MARRLLAAALALPVVLVAAQGAQAARITQSRASARTRSSMNVPVRYHVQENQRRGVTGVTARPGGSARTSRLAPW